MVRRNIWTALLGLALCACALAAEPLPQPPAVTVHFDYYPKDEAQLRSLEQKLGKAIQRAGVGELGETELHADGNDGYLYFYGPNPDRLFGTVSTTLKSSRLMRHAEVTLGGGGRQTTFPLQTGAKR